MWEAESGWELEVLNSIQSSAREPHRVKQHTSTTAPRYLAPGGRVDGVGVVSLSMIRCRMTDKFQLRKGRRELCLVPRFRDLCRSSRVVHQVLVGEAML